MDYPLSYLIKRRLNTIFLKNSSFYLKIKKTAIVIILFIIEKNMVFDQ